MPRASDIRVLVIGLGHVGGSLHDALVKRGIDVVGYDSDALTRSEAHKEGVVVAGSLGEVLGEVDVVFLATPTPSVAGVLKECLGHLVALRKTGSKRHVLFADVASVKGELLPQVASVLRGVKYVSYFSLHPMAGREGSGFLSRSPEVFLGCTWIACPLGKVDPEQVSRAIDLCGESLGGRMTFMSPKSHDEAVAMVSHLPHLLSFTYTQALKHFGENQSWHQLGAGSYKDLSRIAHSDPKRVAEMVLPNREVLKDYVTWFSERLDALVEMLDSANSEENVRGYLTEGALREVVGEEKANSETNSEEYHDEVSAKDLLDVLLSRGGFGWGATSVHRIGERYRIRFSRSRYP